MSTTLHTDRLLLRPMEQADVAVVPALLNDWDVVRTLARVPYPYGLQDAQDWYDRQRKNFQETGWPRNFIICLHAEAESIVIGTIGLMVQGDRSDPELGYWLGRAYWGRGIMSEAAGRIVAHAFEDLGCARIHSGYYAGNAASGRILEKLGFRRIALSPLWNPARARWVDHWDMLLEKADWRGP